jgi:hypothetical protein
MHRRTRPTLIRSILALASIMLASCAQQGARQTEMPHLLRFMPPADEAEVVYLTAAAEGRLVYEDQCFRLKVHGQPPRTIIWHSHFRGVDHNGTPGVVDGHTGTSARAGDHIRLGGGGVDAIGDNIEDRARAKRCGGPYISANTLIVPTR